MSELQFVNGLFFRKPHEKAPEYVIGKLSAKREELINFLQSQNGEWVNMEIKESKQGKVYIAIDSYKPGEATQSPRTNETGGNGYNNQNEMPASNMDDAIDQIPF